MTKLPMPFGNPKTYPGHSGVDYPVGRGTIFRASGPGRVITRSRNDRGGFYVWVQYDNGPLVGYHHMDSHNGVPWVGTRVQEGTQLGYVGSLGKFSTGPHLHSEVSGHATTAGYWQFFDRNRVVGQPGPGPTPPKPTPVPEEDDMIAVHIKDGRGITHSAVIGQGSFRHLIQSDNPEWVKNVVTADDRWTELSIEQLPVLLRTYACDLHIWDIRNGTLVVLDPLDGSVRPGNMWSATNAARSSVEQVKITSTATAAYVAQLAAADKK